MVVLFISTNVTIAALQTGEQLTVNQLLQLMMVPSMLFLPMMVSMLQVAIPTALGTASLVSETILPAQITV